MRNMDITLKPFDSLDELAKEAWQIQDACNLLPVINFTARASYTLRQHGINGDAERSHPIMKVLVGKLNEMLGIEYKATAAYDQFIDTYPAAVFPS